jgi:phospholipid transport system transporter-binding protein
LNAGTTQALFEAQADGRCLVSGVLYFATVSALLDAGSAAISAGQASVIDLKAVSDSDSAGLALLIEWLSVAKQGHHPLHFENIPTQLRQLARLSDVEPLLDARAS